MKTDLIGRHGSNHRDSILNQANCVERSKWAWEVLKVKFLWLGEGLGVDAEGEGDVKMAPWFLGVVPGGLLWEYAREGQRWTALFHFFQSVEDGTRRKECCWHCGACSELHIFIKEPYLWLVKLLDFSLQRSGILLFPSDSTLCQSAGLGWLAWDRAQGQGDGPPGLEELCQLRTV